METVSPGCAVLHDLELEVRDAKISPMKLYGAVELGGTKTLVAVGDGEASLGETLRLETGDEPGPIVGAVVDFLTRHELTSVGIASFGPLELRRGHPGFGSIQATPKPGWSDFNLLSAISAGVGVPVAIETDVNSAALAEGKWGASRGLDNHAYITVGTGVGAGIVVAGDLVFGLAHPEFGHIPVRRLQGDAFEGMCPYHGDCLEGMVSGPALLARFGKMASRLAGEEAARAQEVISHYLAQGVRALVYTVSPERVVLGGGVSKAPGFHEGIRISLLDSLAGYGLRSTHTDSSFVVPPGLGDDSGLVGGLLLARRAAEGR